MLVVAGSRMWKWVLLVLERAAFVSPAQQPRRAQRRNYLFIALRGAETRAATCAPHSATPFHQVNAPIILYYYNQLQ